MLKFSKWNLIALLGAFLVIGLLVYCGRGSRHDRDKEPVFDLSNDVVGGPDLVLLTRYNGPTQTIDDSASVFERIHIRSNERMNNLNNPVVKPETNSASSVSPVPSR
jgi:hypothetical protein